MSKLSVLFFVMVGTIILTSGISDIFSLNARDAGNVFAITLAIWILAYTAIKHAITSSRSR